MRASVDHPHMSSSQVSCASLFPTLSQKTIKLCDNSIDLVQLLHKIRHPVEGVVISHSKSTFGKSSTYCFSGKTLITWLLENTVFKKREICEQLANLLCIVHKVFKCVSNTSTTKILDESSALYQFEHEFQRRIIIIGGGFAGVRMCKELERENYFNVTLIDPKGYFDYLPSLPSLCDNVGYAKNIRLPHGSILKRTKIIADRVIKVSENSIYLSSQTVLSLAYYDHVILATGSRYNLAALNYEPTPKGALVINGMNPQEFITHHDTMQLAKWICVIGAGSVGVEVLASLAQKYPSKQFILVTSTQTIMERSCAAAHAILEPFFTSLKNIHMLLGEKVTKIEHRTIHTNKDKIFEVDIVICCSGFKPNTEFLQHTEPAPNPKSSTTPTTQASDRTKSVVISKKNISMLDTLLKDVPHASIKLAKPILPDHLKDSVPDLDEDDIVPKSIDTKKVLASALQKVKASTMPIILHEAIDKEDVATVVALIDHTFEEKEKQELNVNVDTDFADSSKGSMSLFQHAALNDNVRIMRYLFEKGALPSYKDKNGGSALFYACSRGGIKAATFLLGKYAPANDRDDYENSPLSVALKNSHMDLCKLLILFGADANYKIKKGCTVLHVACREGNLTTVQYLLETVNAMYAATNRNRETPLLYALPHPSVVQYLMDYGLDFFPSKFPTWVCISDYQTNNLLHKCSEKNYVMSLMLILAKLPDRLLKKLAQEKNAHGDTPLHIAIAKKHHAIALALCMTQVCNFATKNNAGKSVHDLAKADLTILNLLNLIPQEKAELADAPQEQQINASESMLEELAMEMEATIAEKPVPRRRSNTIKAGTELPKQRMSIVPNSPNPFKIKEESAATAKKDTGDSSWSELLKTKKLLSSDVEQNKLIDMICNAYANSSMLDKNGYIKVNEFFQIKGHAQFYAIGYVILFFL